MPKARKKKNSSFQTTITKSVFLYGRPNKEKLVILQQMQNSYNASWMTLSTWSWRKSKEL